MCINVKKMYRHIDERYEGNMTAFARAVGLSASTITRIVNGQTEGGGKVVRKIIEYCKKNKLDYRVFITI